MSGAREATVDGAPAYLGGGLSPTVFSCFGVLYGAAGADYLGYHESDTELRDVVDAQRPL